MYFTTSETETESINAAGTGPGADGATSQWHQISYVTFS